jgi:hypothetical protein
MGRVWDGTSVGAKKKGRAEALPFSIKNLLSSALRAAKADLQRLGSFELLGFLQFLSHVL